MNQRDESFAFTEVLNVEAKQSIYVPHLEVKCLLLRM